MVPLDNVAHLNALQISKSVEIGSINGFKEALVTNQVSTELKVHICGLLGYGTM
jgi:hypothetical protein